jgi:hypothetical protein
MIIFIRSWGCYVLVSCLSAIADGSSCWRICQAGFVEIPWDFTVVGLCDLLEEHLDAVQPTCRSDTVVHCDTGSPLKETTGNTCWN